MKYLTRLFTSIRNRGARMTLALIAIKIKAVFNLFVPRTFFGERIGLRPVKSSLTDAEVEQAYKWSQDEDILRWTAASSTKLTLDGFRRKLRHDRWRVQSNQQAFYIVTPAGEMIGEISLYSIDWTKGVGELSIFLDKKYWGQQFGREALNLFIKYIFTYTPVQRIFLGTFKDNLRAQRSFAASGFRIIGEATKLLPSNGELADGVKMELVRNDFQSHEIPH